MKARILCRPKNRQDWLEARRLGITGTDMTGLMGKSNYKSPITIYIDKTSPVVDPEASEAMMLGNMVEDTIAQIYKAKNDGAKIRKVNGILQHPKHDWALANIDRHIIKPKEGVLECKLVGPGRMSEWRDGETPEDHLIQVMWYLTVTGLKVAHIAALVSSTQYEQRVVEFDKELSEALLDLAHDFWHQHVLTNLPPAMDGERATSDWIKRVFSGEGHAIGKNAVERLLGADTLNLDRLESHIEMREARAAQVKALQKELDGFDNTIKHAMGHIEKAEAGRFRINWKEGSRQVVDVENLKLHYPDVAEKVMKTSLSRTMRITKMVTPK